MDAFVQDMNRGLNIQKENEMIENVKLSMDEFGGIHTIEGRHTAIVNGENRGNYYMTHCGISFCCATITDEETECPICKKHGKRVKGKR